MVDWRELVLQGRFNEAEPLILADTEERDGYGGETVARAEFYEAGATVFAPVPRRQSNIGNRTAIGQLYASWSTSGGEGTARMLDVNRVLKKIEGLKC